MRLNKIKCWLIQTAVYDIEALAAEDTTIDLVKKSILKNGYRAYCLNDRDKIEAADWYKNYLLGEKTLFYIDGSGIYRLVNIDLTENEFYFEKDNLPVGYRSWLFYSWQSDYNASRDQIADALNETITEINENRNPRQSLELVESTRPEDGAGDIAEAIKRNIDRSLVAVFDITNVTRVPGEGKTKCYPNANVVFELSYALLKKRKDQVILIRRRRNDIGTDEVPFDFRQFRHIQYETAGQARDKLRNTIIQTLERIGFLG
jgi:hypothetical protein